ncbi:ABC transporter permease [Tabrizicola sp.]|jgi:branched-chain amino acid transport system permease protein|uniref:ABC transporter permease subunit n=1 Tax=Tabrizicola sp. TaxID=2005166 RepID=UPI001355A36F|nr:ABC transporter permease [Tabrizicola sp.]KAF0112916.1 MAG: branched-chain amino acid transport system permease protein [Paracoccaceae bacterium]MDP3198042.1 ABC transporter permease [Tabrizicola sp.]
MTRPEVNSDLNRGASLIDATPKQQRNTLALWLSRLEGPQTLGSGRWFWLTLALAVLAAVIYPLFVDGWTVGNTAYFLVWTFMAMGLGVIWGYAGSLSFGQTAFFGLAGYGYGVLTLNFGAAYGFTLLALALSVGLAALLAVVLGYFMFYGRVQGVFIGIVTLSVTLVFQAFMAQTAGPEWAIGAARLNGFNGMSGMPPLTIPWPGGDVLLYADIALYYVLLGLMLVVYLGLRMLLNAPFGNVLVAIRENPERAEMLGYDVRRYQLLGFVLGGALAGLSGVLYTAWGQYITPSSMSITAAALPVIWVAFGGRKDVTATLIGTLVMIFLYQWLTIYGSQYAIVVMGVILVLTVLFAPEGIVLSLMRWISARLASTGGRP